MKRVAVILTLLPLLALAACTPAEERAAEQEIDTLESEAIDETAEFRMDVEARLAEIDASIDSLEVEAAEAGAEAEAEIEGTVAELREERDSLRRDLQQLGASAEAGLEDLRADVQRRVDELEANIEAAYTDLRDGDGDGQNS